MSIRILLRCERAIQRSQSVLEGFQCCRPYSSRNADNEMEYLKSNPYFNKYADKIASVQSCSPQEFEEKVNSYFHKKNVLPEKKSRSFSNAGKPKPGESVSYLKTKKLDSVMKVESVRDMSAEDITQLWKVHHQKQDKIAAVIPANVYNTIFERSQMFPTFLYPLPRDQGYEFIMAQFNGHQCHFTSLVNYQAFKENAPECLTIIHYPEFQQEKGIVLMNGEYNTEVLNGTDACCLANQLQLYYTSTEESAKYRLLNTFTNDPNNFKHMDLISELGNMNPSLIKS